MKTAKLQRYPDKNQKKVSASDKEHVCPIHGSRLIPGGSQYGIVYRCPVDVCTCLCWSGSTSTPATKEVRQLMISCHAKFDLIWKWKFLSRTKAYRELAYELDIPRSACHLGMMSKEQLEKTILWAERILSEHEHPVIN